MKRIRRFLCHLFPRYRLHVICRSLEIKPYPWQKEYALGFPADFPKGRRTGKTVAVMLRLLMIESGSSYASSLFASYVLSHDPDWRETDLRRCRWYADEYKRMRYVCVQDGLCPMDWDLSKLYCSPFGLDGQGNG